RTQSTVAPPDPGKDRGDPRTKKWSGRRDSNPRPSPWQGDALPTEPLPLGYRPPTIRWCREPESNWRHRDFQSRALPTELSRPDGQPGFGRPSAGPRIARRPKALNEPHPAAAGLRQNANPGCVPAFDQSADPAASGLSASGRQQTP